MSTIPPPDPSAYYAAVTAEDERLAATLAAIRIDEQAGNLTTRDAAGNRVEVLETHLAKLQELRDRYLGEDQGCAEHLLIDCPVCQEGDDT